MWSTFFDDLRADAKKCSAFTLCDTVTERKFKNVACDKSVINELQMKVFATILSTDKVLTKLHLRRCGISENTMRLLAKSLLKNTTLTTLSLGYNDMSRGGGLLVCLLLRDNHTIKYLDLEGTSMQNGDVVELMRSLRHNNGLVYLSLGNCPRLTGKCTHAILTRLKQHKKLMYINFRPCLGGTPKFLEVEEFLEQRYRDEFCSTLDTQESAPWRRNKLMIVGAGSVGKTSMVRSLLNLPFKLVLKSTAGINLIETRAGNAWKQSDMPSFTVDLVSRLAHSAYYEREHTSIEEPIPEFVPTESFEERDNEVIGVNSHSQHQRSAYPKTGASDYIHKYNRIPLYSRKGKIHSRKEFEQNKVSQFCHAMMLLKDDPTDTIKVSIWDYGGQGVFHTMHHLFLTEYGIFVITFSLQEMLRDENGCCDTLKFWLGSIALHASSAPVILVGTFADAVPAECLQNIHENLVAHVKPTSRFQEESDFCFLPISNLNGTGVDTLRTMIQAISEGLEFVNREVPVRWMRSLDWMIEEYNEPWITTQKFRSTITRFGVHSASEVENMLCLFHELGTVIYFHSSYVLRSLIVTKPQWLIDKISLVIRDKDLHDYDHDYSNPGSFEDVDKLFNTGIVTIDLLELLWGPQHLNYLVDLMHQLMLLSHWNFLPGEKQFVIPSMIPKGVGPRLQSPSGVSAHFHFEYLPQGVFERLVCLCVAENDKTDPPQLGYCAALVFLKCGVFLQKQNEDIVVSGVEESRANYVMKMLLAMMRKIKQDVMRRTFEWETLVEDTDSGVMIPFEDAREQKLHPWFTEDEENSPCNETYELDENINRFLEEL